MWIDSPRSFGCAISRGGAELQQSLFLLVPFQTAITQVLLLDQVELSTHHRWLFNLGLIAANRVSVHVDLFQLAQSGETRRYAGESVVGEADVTEFRQLIYSRGESFQLVEAQVECVKLLQEAEFAGHAGQAVVAEVKNLQILEATDCGRNFLQLQ